MIPEIKPSMAMQEDKEERYLPPVDEDPEQQEERRRDHEEDGFEVDGKGAALQKLGRADKTSRPPSVGRGRQRSSTNAPRMTAVQLRMFMDAD